MAFGPFPKSKKAKAKAYCCVSNHRPHSQFAPLPDTLVHHVSMDEKYGKVMQVCITFPLAIWVTPRLNELLG